MECEIVCVSDRDCESDCEVVADAVVVADSEEVADFEIDTLSLGDDDGVSDGESVVVCVSVMD